MGAAVKIGVIGAASAQFSLGLVRDLCLAESLRGSLISLMDPDAERLAMVHRLAERYAGEMGADLRFDATSERESTLTDADFIFNTALVGGHEWQEAWRTQAEALGYYRGTRLLTGMLQYDLMLSLARDVERVCPRAWLIQIGNPLFEGCTLMTRQTGAKVIGLCHPFAPRRLCQIMGLPAEEIEWQAVGVNKSVYLTRLRRGGCDLYPAIDEWIEIQAPEYWRTFRGAFGESVLSRAAVDHYRRVGLMPLADASRTSHEWYYHTDLATKREWYGHLGGFDSEVGWSMYLERLAGNVENTRRVALEESARVSELIPPEPSGESHVPLVDAIANDRPGIFSVNVPNRGAIEGIADDVVVEGKALVDKGGVQLLHVGRLPEKLMLLVLWPRVLKAEQELAAYLTGDRTILEHLLLEDHRTRSLGQAQALVDLMLSQPPAAELAERLGPRSAPLPAYELAAAAV